MDKAQPLRIGPPFISSSVGLLPSVCFKCSFHAPALRLLQNKQLPPYYVPKSGCANDARQMTTPRRFPPPWPVEETDACFIVRDANGQALAYVYFGQEPGRRSAAKLLTRDERAADRREHRQAARVVDCPRNLIQSAPLDRPCRRKTFKRKSTTQTLQKIRPWRCSMTIGSGKKKDLSQVLDLEVVQLENGEWAIVSAGPKRMTEKEARWITAAYTALAELGVTDRAKANVKNKGRRK